MPAIRGGPPPNTRTGASYIDPRTGLPVEGAADTPTGTPYFASSPLVNGGLQSANGTQGNAFKDYVSSQGGGFGNGGATGADAFRIAAGVDPSKLGDTSQWTPAQWQQNNDLFGRVANNDPAAILEAKASSNPFIKETGDNYSTNAQNQFALGNYQTSHGLHNDYAANQNDRTFDPNAANDYATTHTGLPSGVDTDPFGQFDNPAGPAQHGIITPAREAAMGEQAMQLGNRPITDPTTGQALQATPPSIFGQQTTAPTLQQGAAQNTNGATAATPPMPSVGAGNGATGFDSPLCAGGPVPDRLLNQARAGDPTGALNQMTAPPSGLTQMAAPPTDPFAAFTAPPPTGRPQNAQFAGSPSSVAAY